MPEIEKTLLRKKAAAIRRKRDRGGEITARDMEIEALWEKKRSPRGRKTAMASPGNDNQNPDEVDTISDAIPEDLPTEVADTVIDDTEPTIDRPMPPPPPPPKVRPSQRITGKADVDFILKYRRGADAGSREATCRFMTELVIMKTAIPCIEKHEQFGMVPPVTRDMLLPKGTGANEVRPMIYDDGVCAVHEYTPEGIKIPPGVFFLFMVGSLWVSTWRLTKAIENGQYQTAPAEEVASEATTEEPIVKPSPARSGNGATPERFF